MYLPRILFSLAFPAFLSATAATGAEPVTIVSWNAEATLPEALEKRRDDLRRLDGQLKPDVLVLIEVTGLQEAKLLASHLGWSNYQAVLSDFSDARQQAFEGLEVAVISKLPIASATEYDTSPDGVHDVFGQAGYVRPVFEKLLTSQGISGVETTGANDRGTLRVDLDNGLTIFPVHLKSNSNNPCSDVSSALQTMNSVGVPAPQTLQDFQSNGFEKATKAHASNAAQRERVIAAVAKVAETAIAEGRIVVIVGDYNTSFEPGKVGQSLSDCTLQNFTCARAPFPAAACAGGDGYDDTFAILQFGLVGNSQWKILSENLGRTYDDPAFADKAIDHIAVPLSQQQMFSTAQKSAETFGSDHFAVWTTATLP